MGDETHCMLKCKNEKKMVNIKRTLFTNIQKQFPEVLLLNDDDKLIYLLKCHDEIWGMLCCIGVKTAINYLENNFSGVVITRIYVTMTELSWEHETIFKNVHPVFTRI